MCFIYRKMDMLKQTYQENIKELKEKMNIMEKSFIDEKTKIEDEYQTKIDEMFSQSSTQLKKISESENQNEVLKHKLSFTKLESTRYKDLVQSLLISTNICIDDEFSIEKGVNDLLNKIKENIDTIDTLKNDIKVKDGQLKSLSNEIRDSEYQSKNFQKQLNDEINKSKDQIKLKNQQIEATQKVLKESRDLLGMLKYKFIVYRQEETH